MQHHSSIYIPEIVGARSRNSIYRHDFLIFFSFLSPPAAIARSENKTFFFYLINWANDEYWRRTKCSDNLNVYSLFLSTLWWCKSFNLNFFALLCEGLNEESQVFLFNKQEFLFKGFRAELMKLKGKLNVLMDAPWFYRWAENGLCKGKIFNYCEPNVIFNFPTEFSFFINCSFLDGDYVSSGIFRGIKSFYL